MFSNVPTVCCVRLGLISHIFVIEFLAAWWHFVVICGSRFA